MREVAESTQAVSPSQQKNPVTEELASAEVCIQRRGDRVDREVRMSAVAVLGLLLSVGCADALPPQSQPTATSARVTLAPGEDASTLGGAVTLRFDDVVSDSRCPTSEQCVWAGRAEVALTVTARGASASYRVFAPGASPTGVAHEDLYIELLQLDPHPKTSRGIAKDQYRATFEVRRE